MSDSDSTTLTPKKQSFDLESLKKGKVEHVVILSDVSDSMYAPFDNTVRSEALVESVKALIHSSDPRRTEYTLAQFSSDARILVSKTNKYTKILMNLTPYTSGGTRMDEGLQLAMNQEPNRIILLSDGEPTCDRYSLMALVNKCAELGIRIDTIGIGDANTDLMAQIAFLTGGKYQKATTVKELQGAYKALETKTYLLIGGPVVSL